MRARSAAAALAVLALLAPAAPTAAQAPVAPPPVEGVARDPQLRPPTVKIGWAGDIAFSSRQGLPRGGPERALRGVAG
ncbi:MAG: hypothetical protein QOC91_591, partial [Solirubrobacteraceae bacterium]|nr:hypothetical protein [Solirubrobacteraceae bacterium]